jgi:hypothetical protein
MRARTVIIVAAAAAAVLAGGVSPSAAESERAAAAKAVAGRMLATPRADAFVTRLPVRVVVRAPAGTSRLRVRLGGRDVTARFRRTRGSLRVANLTRGDGLRFGHNHLSVLAERRSGRPVMDARSFVLARRDAGLVRLRVRPGPVTSLHVRVAGRASLTPEHFGKPGAVERRLSVIRRTRTVRVWLNGRRVTRAVDRSRPTRWTAKLSATHGLRYGVNRLRILVAEPDSGRYAVLRRRFLVRRNRHLAGAGWDVATRVGGRVRLDGRRSRTARGGRPDHSWRIVSKPRGSRAKLRRRGSARPLLTPDRPGRYVVGVTLTDRTRRATASQAPPSSTDLATVTVGHRDLLLPFKGLTVKDGHPGIQVGGTFYPNWSPGWSAMQWLTLDRETLTPTKTGNSWLDGTGGGDHGIGALTTALSTDGYDQLVILSYPYAGGPGPPVQQDQIAAFNDAMKTLGVDPIPAGILQDHNKLAIVGVPSGGAGSGWYTHGGGPVDALTGWLMPDAVKDGQAFRFRFQPQRPEFDTSSSSTPTTNTMTLAGRHIGGALPAGATGGFHVVKLNPIDLTPDDSQVIPTNGTYSSTWWRDMAEFLGYDTSQPPSNFDPPRTVLAVQSIGHVRPYDDDESVDAWRVVSKALAGYGANPHTFNTVDGSYAFLGGPQLERSEVADSSSTVVIDPTKDAPRGRETGTLRGRMSMRADGYFTPVIADPAESLEFSLYDTAFSNPTPWPYTAGGTFPQQQASPGQNCPAPGTDVDAYANALSYIAVGIDLPDKYKADLRAAYIDQSDWHDEHSDLLALPYQPGHGFGQAEFCNLKAELKLEFEWLDATQDLFDSYSKVLDRSRNQQLVDLDSIGTAVRTAVGAPDNSAEIAWSVGGFVGNATSAAILGFDPEATVALAAWEALVTVYELVRELVSTGAAPVGDQIASKVQDLSRDVATHLSAAATGLDRVRDVISSDYGRLRALGPNAKGSLKIDASTMQTNLTNAADAFFSSQLIPLASEVWFLTWSATNHSPTTDNCYIFFIGHAFRGAPPTAQLQYRGPFDSPYGREFGGLWVLGEHTLSASEYAYLPATLTNKTFLPITKNGYGVQLPDFMWSQYESPPTRTTVCH